MSQSAFPDEITQRYSVKEIIGAGGMGQILRAYDPNLNIDVAIKVLHSLDSEITAIRLQREAIAAGKLQHLNITRVFDFGLTSNNVPYMVMEFLEGEILSDILLERGSLSVKESIEIFLQICSGLEHAHKNGIVHRDLKPSNIIIVKSASGKQIVKIFDFGLAQLENAEQKLTAFNTTVGSPPYMSPEQVCALEVDSRSDIYSLGCLLFETLTGALPLKGRTPIETMTMQRDLAPPLISEIKEDAKFPGSLVELVDKCLAKLPQDRPQSAELMASELESIRHEVLRQEFSGPEPEPVAAFQPKRFSQRAIKIFLVGIVLTGIAVALGTDQYLKNKNRQEALNSNLFDQSQRKPATLKTLAPVVEANKIFAKGPKLAPDQTTETLELSGDEVSDENLKNLVSLKRLSTLKISSEKLSDLGVEQIVKIKPLKILTLDSDKISNKVVGLLVQLPNLSFLALESKNINDDCILNLAHIKKLQGLSLCNTSCSPDVGLKLAQLPLVKSISLEGNSAISKKSIDAFAKAGVQQLNLGFIPIGKEEWHAMRNLTQLFRLDATNTKETPAFVEELSALAKWKYLDLHKSPVIDERLISSLLKLKLQYLDLSDTTINDKQLVKLAKMGTLVNLRLKNCPQITPEGVAEFHHFFNLVWHRDCVVEISTSAKDVAS